MVFYLAAGVTPLMRPSMCYHCRLCSTKMLDLQDLDFLGFRRHFVAIAISVYITEALQFQGAGVSMYVDSNQWGTY